MYKVALYGACMCDMAMPVLGERGGGGGGVGALVGPLVALFLNTHSLLPGARFSQYGFA